LSSSSSLLFTFLNRDVNEAKMLQERERERGQRCEDENENETKIIFRGRERDQHSQADFFYKLCKLSTITNKYVSNKALGLSLESQHTTCMNCSRQHCKQC